MNEDMTLYSIFIDSTRKPAVSGYPINGDNNLINPKDANGFEFTEWVHVGSKFIRAKKQRFFVGLDIRYSTLEENFSSLKSMYSNLAKLSEELRKDSVDPRMGIFLDKDGEILDIRILDDCETMLPDHDELMVEYNERHKGKEKKSRRHYIKKL